MPTLPLYTPNPAHPNASHAVLAPGGYERWYFDAESADGKVVVVIVFAIGSPDHPDYSEYLKRHGRYLRGPTRNRPPVPGEFPSVSIAVHEEGRTVSHVVRAVAPGSFKASPDRPGLAVEDDAVICEPDGGFRLRAGGVDLAFRPLLSHAPRDLARPSRPDGPLRHHWLLVHPSCAVEGVVRVEGGRAIGFAGRGYHDYAFGTEPMGEWVRGRMFGDDRVIVFHSTWCAGRSGAGPRHRSALVLRAEVQSDGVRETETFIKFEAARYPARISFEQDGQALERQRILESSASVDRAIYASSAVEPTSSAGRSALCEWY
jgi:hypothetical protein